MRIQLKERKDWEGNFLGKYDIYLNSREVGNEANDCLSDVWAEQGLKSIKSVGYKAIGETSTNKTFEIFGGIKAGGARNDWFLEVDGVTVEALQIMQNILSNFYALVLGQTSRFSFHTVFTKKIYKSV